MATEEADSEQWERCKENFAPIRRGRSLHDVLGSASSSKHALEAKRRELLNEINEYTGDDPMDPWLK